MAMNWASAGTLARFAPGAAALAAYDRSWLRADLLAGISVAAVAVPIAIAYSQLAGVPPVHGLYASILPLLAYAVFGTSRQLILAPDAATCAIVAAVVTPLAAGDAARHVPLSAALAILTGVLCIAAGIARLGFLANFLARPILVGYLNGIAISIISDQLGKFFGFDLPRGGFFREMAAFFASLDQTHAWTLGVGLAVFALLLVLKHLAPRAPGPLVAVIVGVAATNLLDLGSRGVALLGPIPAGLPAPSLPIPSAQDLGPLVFGAVGLMIISFNSAMVTARGFALKNRYDIDPNREFIALGVADVGAGILQGYAISGADSRTAVNDAVGGKSQVTGLVAAGLLVLTLLFLTGPLAALPIAVLAAVLMHSAISLFDLRSLATLRRVSRQEFRLSVVTLLGVITVGVLPGVAIAVALALLQLLARASRPHDAVLGRARDNTGFHDLTQHPDVAPVPGLVLYRFESALLFFNADYFKSRVREVSRAAPASTRHFIIVAETMPMIDSTGAATLSELCAELTASGMTVAVAGAHAQVREMLARTGLIERIGADCWFRSLEAAVARLQGAVAAPEPRR
jgi:high affinity sulfate transporter 1